MDLLSSGNQVMCWPLEWSQLNPFSPTSCPLQVTSYCLQGMWAGPGWRCRTSVTAQGAETATLHVQHSFKEIDLAFTESFPLGLGEQVSAICTSEVLPRCIHISFLTAYSFWTKLLMCKYLCCLAFLFYLFIFFPRHRIFFTSILGSFNQKCKCDLPETQWAK